MCRETGMMVELSDVPVHSLVPEQLRSVASADEFMAALPQYDDQMAQQLDEATAAGDCLRFVGEAQLRTCHCQSSAENVRCMEKMRLSALLRVEGNFGAVIISTASSSL